MKKNLTLISLMLGVMVLVSAVGVVSAASATFHPQKGVDATPSESTGQLSSSDLGKVEVSDDNRYVTSYWDLEYYSDYEYLNFSDFGMTLPSGSVIDSVTLNFEWKADSSVDNARIFVWDDSASSWSSAYDLTPSTSDQTEVLDLSSYINSEDDLDNLGLKFQAHNHGSGKETKHDLVEIVVEYHLPECQIIVTNPNSGYYSGTISVEWVFSQECLSDDWDLAYKEGSCDLSGTGWVSFADTVDSPEDFNTIGLNESSQYCIKVEGDNHGDEVNFSGLFDIDNTAPTVEANGPYTCDEGSNVTLDSTGTSDSGSGIASYEWKVNGVVVSTASSYSYPCEDGYNLYPVTLTVEDVAGNVGNDTSSVEISNKNPWNVQIGGDSSGVEGSSVSFTGSANDVLADIPLNYAWDFDSDGIVDSTDQNPSHTYMANDTYTVTLNVSDKDGGWKTKTKDIAIADASPTADAGANQEIDEGQTISVDASGSSTPADPITLYEWDWTTDGIYDDTGITATSPAYMNNGTYTVTLRVTDSDGSQDTDTLTVTVNDLGPTASLSGDTVLDEGELGSWDASASTSYPDDIVSYEWDWDYDGSFDASGDTGATQTHAYDYDESYTVAVKVTDEDGSFDIAELDVTVKNEAPYFLNLPASVNTAVGDSFSFDVDAEDPSPHDTLTYGLVSGKYPAWMSIDSSTGEITGTSTTTGIYTANVSVTDGTDTVYEILTVTVYDYSIHLDEGWNLISIPLVPEDDNISIESVLSTVADKVQVVWAYTYDESTDRNEWTYQEVTAGEFDSTDGLQDMVPGYGYYIYMSEEAELYLNGKKSYEINESTNVTESLFAVPPSVTLAMDSWNLIGVYGYKNGCHSWIGISDALISLTDEEENPYYDIIYDEDGLSPHVFESTEGYWLSVKKIFAGNEDIEYKANYNNNPYQWPFQCYN